jgi:hypothetical protein
VSKPVSTLHQHSADGQVQDLDDDLQNEEGRFIRYNFTDSFLRIKTIGAT